ncbi:hypothetical protein GCM10020331_009980 [Ectobacillus funiculus]
METIKPIEISLDTSNPKEKANIRRNGEALGNLYGKQHVKNVF